MTHDYLRKITLAQELKTFLIENPDTIIIDVLPPDHFAAVHLPNAKNVCVFFVSFINDLKTVAPDKTAPVVVYGSSMRSNDAAMAVDKMTREGYQQINQFTGGLEAWRAAGYDLEGDTPEFQDDPQSKILLPTLTTGSYIIDPEKSTLQWTGRNPTSTHIGTVDISKGEIHCQKENITGAFEIDMNSIHNVNLEGNELQPVLEAHLRSDDFFFTTLFPKAVFLIKDVTSIEPGWQTYPNFHVHGELTMRGVTESLDFDVIVSLPETATLLLEAHFDLDRTKWGIIYGSSRFFEHLGMHKVFDLISLQLRIVASCV